jgi:hypothetical protein
LFPSLPVSISHPFATLPSQSSLPGGHVLTHAPPLQIRPGWHALPHMPQWLTFESVFVSQPLSWLPSQLPNPGSHVTRVHVPPVHDSTAFGMVHGWLQPPQCERFVLVLISHPLVWLPSQSAKFALQLWSRQVPLAQDSVAFAKSHGTLHSPQSDAVLSGVSHPFCAWESQLP